MRRLAFFSVRFARKLTTDVCPRWCATINSVLSYHLYYTINVPCTIIPTVLLTVLSTVVLRGTIVDRACGIHKKLQIWPFLLTIFGPIYYGPPQYQIPEPQRTNHVNLSCWSVPIINTGIVLIGTRNTYALITVWASECSNSRARRCARFLNTIFLCACVLMLLFPYL